MLTPMKKVTGLFIFLLMLHPLFARQISFLYMAQSGYQPLDILTRADAFYRKTGIKVTVHFPQYKDRYGKIMSSFTGETSPYDVILIDLIWMKSFIQEGYIEPLPPLLVQKVKEGIIPEIYSSFAYGPKLWAVPFHADFQLLYVNRKLLSRAGFTAPPKTLEALVSMAEEAKRKGLLPYPLFDSWNRQEVLVCEYTWLTGAFGGTLTGKNGKIKLVTEPALKALNFMVELLKKGLMNPYSLKSDELFASEVFLSGDCLFSTNWTFLAELARTSSLPIKDDWFPALIPVSKSIYRQQHRQTVSISGYEGLGVPAASRDKRDAWAFIEFLSSPDFQEKHLDYMSVWKKVWSEKNTLANDPYIRLKERQIKGVCNRPVSSDYNTVSTIVQKWIYEALLMHVTPSAALQNAQKEIDSTEQEMSSGR